jgi:hypothetical protein
VVWQKLLALIGEIDELLTANSSSVFDSRLQRLPSGCRIDSKDLKVPQPSVVVTGDDVRKAKPSSDVFVLAAKRLRVPIENCVVVGDSPWDMLAAGRRRALGVGILAGGYSKGELEESGAFRVYADPADMLLHIEDLGIAGK